MYNYLDEGIHGFAGLSRGTSYIMYMPMPVYTSLDRAEQKQNLSGVYDSEDNVS